MRKRHAMALTEAVSLAAARFAHAFDRRRGAARLVAWAGDEKLSPWLVAGFVVLHVVLWTVILIRLRPAQDVHFDVAEAFAWARNSCLVTASIPASGWVAGIWFMLFPVTDWSTYALAMVTVVSA